MAYVVLVICVLTAPVHFLFPVPAARSLPGRFKLIGTTSFDIPLVDLEAQNSSISQRSPVSSDRKPVSVGDGPENIFTAFYQTHLRGRALLWTSGNPRTEYQESDELLKQVAINYKLPDLILHHLSLSQTNSIFQRDFSGMSHSRNSGFPVAIYSHGMYGWRQCHHSACEALASHGFLVFAVDHAPDCMLSRPAGDLRGSVKFDYTIDETFGTKRERDFYTQGFDRRSNDIVALLDFILSPALGRRFPDVANKIDFDRVNLWGHSFGGGTVSTVCCRDDRVNNAVVLDGWLYPMPDADRQSGFKSASLLNISSDLWPYAKYQFPFRADLITSTLKNEPPPTMTSHDMVLKGSDHQNFCDTYLICHKSLLAKPTVIGPDRDPTELLSHVDSMIVAFFSRGALNANKHKGGSTNRGSKFGGVSNKYNADTSKQKQAAEQKLIMRQSYRLIVVATNVAETSITIPNIRYVVDAGRQKEKVQQTSSAIAKYEVRFVSKASADQRQGRSGRTGPGHCYRLFSANYYHTHMPMFQPPEIMQTPLEDLILQMKSIGIDHIESFPFPTAPPVESINSALGLLTYLGAVYTAATANTASTTQILNKIETLTKMAKSNKKALASLEDTRGLTELGQ
eukprot:gene25471-31937_t